MSDDEKFLVYLLECSQDRNVQATLLQSFIAEKGPLSEAAGEKVRAILSS